MNTTTEKTASLQPTKLTTATATVAIYRYTSNPYGSANHKAYDIFASRFPQIAQAKAMDAENYIDLLSGIENNRYTYGIIPAIRNSTSQREAEDILSFWAKDRPWPVASIAAEEEFCCPEDGSMRTFHVIQSSQGNSTILPPKDPTKAIRLFILDANTGSPKDIVRFLELAKMELVFIGPANGGKPGQSVFYVEYRAVKNSLTHLQPAWHLISGHVHTIGNFMGTAASVT